MALAAAHELHVVHAQAAWLLVGAPLSEELVFRAGLQAWLQRRTSTAVAAALGSLAFAACHVAVDPSLRSVLTFLPALALGALYARTGSLIACVVLHAVFNAWSMSGTSLLPASLLP